MIRLRLPASERPVWYHALLVVLLVSMGTRHIAYVMKWGDMLVSLTNVLLLLACVMAMGRARFSRHLGWAALLPATVLTVVFRNHHAVLACQALMALIMAMVCWRILQRIFTTRDVTWATISGAVAVFLLISSLWTIFYAMAAWAMVLEPAFQGVPPASELLASTDTEHARADVNSLLAYFSLVTQTTLGYGDISPAHPTTRMLAVSQAVIGQLYLVVLVARLVSMQKSGSQADPL
jgi:hypothetical protein